MRAVLVPIQTLHLYGAVWVPVAQSLHRRVDDSPRRVQVVHHYFRLVHRDVAAVFIHPTQAQEWVRLTERVLEKEKTKYLK